MEFLWIGIAAVVVLLGAAAWIDLKARRAGRPIRGVDQGASREASRATQTEYNQRTHHQNYRGGMF